MWRIVASPKLTATYAEIRDSWTIHDLIQAHKIVDELERAEAKAHARARQEAEANGS